MSKIIGNKLTICKEKSDKCEYCGKIAELRPYGKGGDRICYQCGMDNIGETEKNFQKVLDSVDKEVLVNLNDISH